MPRLVNRNPTYRKHRASGQAIVTIDSQDIYPGPFGTQARRLVNPSSSAIRAVYDDVSQTAR